MISAPGRVNLIGEHIDYHLLPVLPVALQRSIRVDFSPRADHHIRAASDHYDPREFDWTRALTPVARGDWENYLRAAAQAIAGKWGVLRGINAHITSDLPAAAGLSSSSALIVAFTLALLGANHIEATFEELMEILPEGEHFVGTRGGGMDHAASLASRAGCASLIHFAPIRIEHFRVPPGWRFLVAHSGQTAEKSGAVRDRYNAVRIAGVEALRHLGFASYSDAVARADLASITDPIFLHVVSEARRVMECVAAMQSDDPVCFGRLLLDSHASLRDRLRVSTPALDNLVETAMSAGAVGARLTGAGFGGCAVILCREPDLARVQSTLVDRAHPPLLFEAVPGPGALLS